VYLCGKNVGALHEIGYRNVVGAFVDIFVAAEAGEIIHFHSLRDAKSMDLFAVEIKDDTVIHHMPQLQLHGGRHGAEVEVGAEIERLYVLPLVVEAANACANGFHGRRPFISDQGGAIRPQRIVKGRLPPIGAQIGA
jgi:hypothetical protein